MLSTNRFLQILSDEDVTTRDYRVLFSGPLPIIEVCMFIIMRKAVEGCVGFSELT